MSLEKIDVVGKRFRRNPEKKDAFRRFVIMKRLDDRLVCTGGYKGLLTEQEKVKFPDVIAAVDKVEVWDAIELNTQLSGSRFSPNNENRMRQLRWGDF